MPKLIIIDYSSGSATIKEIYTSADPLTEDSQSEDYESYIKSLGFRIKDVHWAIVETIEYN